MARSEDVTMLVTIRIGPYYGLISKLSECYLAMRARPVAYQQGGSR